MKKDMEDPENRECTFKPHVQAIGSGVNNSANKWDELYHQAARKQNRTDRDQDEIEYDKNHHEMRFAPEVHEINNKGTKNPIKSSMSKKVGLGLRNRLQEKLGFLNEGQFNTLAD